MLPDNLLDPVFFAEFLFAEKFDVQAVFLSPAPAKPFSSRTSSLPPSKEGGQGDCGRTNKTVPSEQRAFSVRRQPFIQPSLVPARPG